MRAGQIIERPISAAGKALCAGRRINRDALTEPRGFSESGAFVAFFAGIENASGPRGKIARGEKSGD